MEEMYDIDIFLLRCVPTNKNNHPRTFLEFGTPETDSSKIKGLLILEQWIEGHEVFNTLPLKKFCVPLKGKFVYERTFRGQAKMVLKAIYDENGNCLLAID
mgnify:CR=1 FL=1